MFGFFEFESSFICQINIHFLHVNRGRYMFSKISLPLSNTLMSTLLKAHIAWVFSDTDLINDGDSVFWLWKVICHDVYLTFWFQFSQYWNGRTLKNFGFWKFRGTPLKLGGWNLWIFIVLAHWNNSPWAYISVYI